MTTSLKYEVESMRQEKASAMMTKFLASYFLFPASVKKREPIWLAFQGRPHSVNWRE